MFCIYQVNSFVPSQVESFILEVIKSERSLAYNIIFTDYKKIDSEKLKFSYLSRDSDSCQYFLLNDGRLSHVVTIQG